MLLVICSPFYMFFISETKLDITFPNTQFRVPGFKHYRADRNGNGGGIAAYIRNDLPHRRRSDLESMIVSLTEAMVIEVIIRKEVWLYYCVYNPHFKHKQTCCAMIDDLIDVSQTSRLSNIFLIGDLNINLMCENDCKCLKDWWISMVYVTSSSLPHATSPATHPLLMSYLLHTSVGLQRF